MISTKGVWLLESKAIFTLKLKPSPLLALIIFYHFKMNHLILNCSLLCRLSDNVCHSPLPPLARPTLGRTQASPDPKGLLPFHLLPGFTDVSIRCIRHRGCHGNLVNQNSNCSLYHSRVVGFFFWLLQKFTN